MFDGKDRKMDNERPKQILDTTFKHLEKVLEEMKQEKLIKEKIIKNSKLEARSKKQKNPDL